MKSLDENQKKYLNEISKKINAKGELDDSQLEVIMDEGDRTLVVAGAGAGKSSTIAIKVAYLIEKCGYDPSEILMLSFSQDAVADLRSKVEALGVKVAGGQNNEGCNVRTFHSIGLEIINFSEEKKIVKELNQTTFNDFCDEKWNDEWTKYWNKPDKDNKKTWRVMQTFINRFEQRGYDNDKEAFDEMKKRAETDSDKLFLDMASSFWDYYVEYKKNKKNEKNESIISYSDMIIDAYKKLTEEDGGKPDYKFRYIIVDEYQDISRQRYNLVKALADTYGTKLMAVGDDWQSIYRFAGSELSLFTDFKNEMGKGKDVRLIRMKYTYRNTQALIDIAGKFVMKNPAQIEKELVSMTGNVVDNPVVIVNYDRELQFRYYNQTAEGDEQVVKEPRLNDDELEQILDEIVDNRINEGKDPYGSILLLGRYGRDLKEYKYGNYKKIGRRRVFSFKYPKLKIEFLTVHSSKGLQYEDVIILNGSSGEGSYFGFPSIIQDDPVLKYVENENSDGAVNEERRLFYVAMTRTKNRVYIAAPGNDNSEFINEIRGENGVKEIALQHVEREILLTSHINNDKIFNVTWYDPIGHKEYNLWDTLIEIIESIKQFMGGSFLVSSKNMDDVLNNRVEGIDDFIYSCFIDYIVGSGLLIVNHEDGRLVCIDANKLNSFSEDDLADLKEFLDDSDYLKDKQLETDPKYIELCTVLTEISRMYAYMSKTGKNMFGIKKTKEILLGEGGNNTNPSFGALKKTNSDINENALAEDFDKLEKYGVLKLTELHFTAGDGERKYKAYVPGESDEGLEELIQRLKECFYEELFQS